MNGAVRAANAASDDAAPATTDQNPAADPLIPEVPPPARCRNVVPVKDTPKLPDSNMFADEYNNENSDDLPPIPM